MLSMQLEEAGFIAQQPLRCHCNVITSLHCLLCCRPGCKTQCKQLYPQPSRSRLGPLWLSTCSWLRSTLLATRATDQLSCQSKTSYPTLFSVLQIRLQDSVQAAAAAAERQIRADNYRATLVANMQLAQVRAARDEADRQAELARSEAELASTIADPYLAEDPAMAASSLSSTR